MASRVVGVPSHTDTFSALKFLIGPTGVASLSITVGRGAWRTDTADTIDFSESLSAAALLLLVVIDLVDLAFLLANPVLVGVVALRAMALAIVMTIVGVEWTCHTVSLTDEVILGTNLTNFIFHSKAWVADTLASLS